MEGEHLLRITKLTEEVSTHKATVTELQVCLLGLSFVLSVLSILQEKLHAVQELQKTQETEDQDLKGKIATLTNEKVSLEQTLAQVRAEKNTLELTHAETEERLEEAEVSLPHCFDF